MKTIFEHPETQLLHNAEPVAKPATRPGFTLIELMATLAIIALLALTLVPTLAGSRTDAKSFNCLNNNRQLCLAWRMYADDNNNRIVFASDDGMLTGPY